MDEDAWFDIPPGVYVHVAINGNASTYDGTITKEVGEEDGGFFP